MKHGNNENDDNNRYIQVIFETVQYGFLPLETRGETTEEQHGHDNVLQKYTTTWWSSYEQFSRFALIRCVRYNRPY